MKQQQLRPPASPSPLPSSASTSDEPMASAPPPSQPSTDAAPSSQPSTSSAPPGASAPPSSPPSPPLTTAKPNADPSLSAGNSASAYTANPSAAAAVGGPTGPTKIPSRPRKARKIAVSAAAPQGDVKTQDDAAAAAEGSSNSSSAIVVAAGGAPAELSNRARVMYRVLPRPLSAEGEVAAAIRRLRAADPELARVIDVHEPPVFQSLHPPFHSLTRSILYQQLAFKAAASIYSRFLALCGGEAGVVPETVLGLTPHQLRQIGVSARKASYLHDLANKYCNGILSDSSIVAMDDKSLFTMLTMVKGIGAWSVHMFMIFSLHRPDVLPVGDLGVRKGVQLLYGLDALPRPSQMEQLCERWKPYRSVGAWYMWRLVEAKGAPAALATVPSGGAAIAAAAGGEGGIGGAELIAGVPPSLPSLPQHQHLQQQIHQQQHPQHHQSPQHQHPHHRQHHQHQQQQQLQMQPQLVDAIQSIPNLGLFLSKPGEWAQELWFKE